MNKKTRIPFAQPKFRVGNTYASVKKDEIFQGRGAKLHDRDIPNYKLRKTPRPVYELEDLNKVIDGQFYEQEITPVRITKRTTFRTDKILRTRVKRGIKEYLVRWKGYNQDFDSWIPA